MYDKPGADTAAEGLRQRFSSALASALRSVPTDTALPAPPTTMSDTPHEETEADEEQDILATYEDASIEAFKNDKSLLNRLK